MSVCGSPRSDMLVLCCATRKCSSVVYHSSYATPPSLSFKSPSVSLSTLTTRLCSSDKSSASNFAEEAERMWFQSVKKTTVCTTSTAHSPQSVFVHVVDKHGKRGNISTGSLCSHLQLLLSDNIQTIFVLVSKKAQRRLGSVSGLTDYYYY